MIRIKCKTPIYGTIITLVVSDDKEFKEYMLDKCSVECNVKGNCGNFFGNPRYGGIVWMPSFKHESIENIATLAHECIHASTYVLDHNGMQVSFDNDEAIAYLMNYYLEYFLGKLKRVMENRK